MNSNKISLIIVLSSFIIGGGFIVAANIPTQKGDSSSVVSSSDKERSDSEDDKSSSDDSSVYEPVTESSSSSLPDSTVSSESDISSEEESSADDCSRPKADDNIPRDDDGLELSVDVMPIVDAYLSGDSSSLNDKEYMTLEAAKQFIDENITADMTDYDKAKTIHDYILANNEYNENALGAISLSTYDESSPYGVLVLHKSVCKGYSTTFKLLCNMCGLECELIVEYERMDIHHSYNRVRLDGIWYYTDPTWDDHDDNTYDYRYFCLSKEQMAYNHALDNSCPETESFKDTYAVHNLTDAGNIDEYKKALKAAFDSGTPMPYYFRLGKNTGVNLIMHDDAIGFDYYFEDSENIKNIRNASQNINGSLFYEFSKIVIDDEVILAVSTYK